MKWNGTSREKTLTQDVKKKKKNRKKEKEKNKS